MWEIAIGYMQSVLNENERQSEHLYRMEAIEECPPDQLEALLAGWVKQDAEKVIERRHQEHMQAIRDSKSTTTVNVWGG